MMLAAQLSSEEQSEMRREILLANFKGKQNLRGPSPRKRLVLTNNDVAKLLSIKKTTLSQYISSGRLPLKGYCSIRKKWLDPTGDFLTLARYMADNGLL